MPTPAVSALAALQLALVPAFPGLEFDDPLYVAQPPGEERLLVVEQGGKIWSVEGGRKEPFLDLSRKTRGAGEMGLLGLAFHPRYRENGYFYVYYSDNRRRLEGRDHDSVLSRFGKDKRETELLRIAQPYSNHNGGCLQFGPDGRLYLGLGDGGSAGDPRGSAQDPGTLLGKMVRIDVDAEEVRPEVWASGLRNPWRFSFDRETGELWAGDVGQNEVEEIDVVEKGKNYGWDLFEGTRRFEAGPDADRSKYAFPVVEYEQEKGGRSVIGGYVYRGRRFPALRGVYLYGDFTSGRIRGLRRRKGKVLEDRELLASGLPISSFGEDSRGELYVTAFDGQVYRVEVR